MIARLKDTTTSALLVLLVALLASGSAFAQEEAGDSGEEGHQFEKTASVHPVMLDNRVAQDLAVSSIAFSQGETPKDETAKTNRMMQGAMEASSFAGAATEGDLWAMKAGLLGGSLVFTRDNNPAMHKAALDWLGKNMKPVESLDDATANAFTAYIQAVKENKEAEAVAPLYSKFMVKAYLNSTAKEVTEDNEGRRLHGYLLGGAWAALAHQSAVNGKAPKSIIDFGKALQQIFENESIEGGTDQQLAKQLAVITDELEKEKPEAETVAQAIEKMNTIAGGKGDVDAKNGAKKEDGANKDDAATDGDS